MRFLLVLCLFAAYVLPTKGYPYIWEAEEENSNLNEDIQENGDTSGSGNDDNEDSQASGEERKRSVEDEEKGPKESFSFSSPYGSLKITPFKVSKNKRVKKRCVCAFGGGCPGEFEVSGFPCGMGGCGNSGCMCGMGGGCNGWGGFGGGFNGGCGYGGGCPGGCCGGFRPMPMPMVMCPPKTSEKEEKDEPSSSADEEQKGSPSESSESKQVDSSEGESNAPQPDKPDQKTPAQAQSAGSTQQSPGNGAQASPADDKKNDQLTADSPDKTELKPVMVKVPDADGMPGEPEKKPQKP